MTEGLVQPVKIKHIKVHQDYIYVVIESLQMELSAHFQAIASGTIVRLDKLDINRRYPVTYARRLLTQYGPTVLLTLQTEAEQNVKILLPKRYAGLYTENDIEEINNGISKYKLIYRGKAGFSHIINMEL